MGHKVEAIYAIIGTDDDGDEGIVGVQVNGERFPLVTTMPSNLDGLARFAGMTNYTNARLLKFSQIEDLSQEYNLNDQAGPGMAEES